MYVSYFIIQYVNVEWYFIGCEISESTHPIFYLNYSKKGFMPNFNSPYLHCIVTDSLFFRFLNYCALYCHLSVITIFVRLSINYVILMFSILQPILSIGVTYDTLNFSCIVDCYDLWQHYLLSFYITICGNILITILAIEAILKNIILFITTGLTLV